MTKMKRIFCQFSQIVKYDIAVMLVDRRSVNIVEKRDPNPIPLTDSLPALFWPQDKFALFGVLPFPGKTRVLNCQRSICQISDLVKILNIVFAIGAMVIINESINKLHLFHCESMDPIVNIASSNV